jgi:hypothetical protein
VINSTQQGPRLSLPARFGIFASSPEDVLEGGGDVRPTLEYDAGIELSHGLHHPQAGAHRSLRVILMGLRIAEIDEQAIAKILGDSPSKRAITLAQAS